MIAVAVTVSKSFSLLLIILNNGFAASPHARANAAAIIIGGRSLPIRCISRSAWRVHGSGAGRTRTTGRNIARTTLSRWNEIASSSAGETENAGWRILQTTSWPFAKCWFFNRLILLGRRLQLLANNIPLVSPLPLAYKSDDAVRVVQVMRADSGTSGWSYSVLV